VVLRRPHSLAQVGPAESFDSSPTILRWEKNCFRKGSLSDLDKKECYKRRFKPEHLVVISSVDYVDEPLAIGELYRIDLG
jgi:hypothetical protein